MAGSGSSAPWVATSYWGVVGVLAAFGVAGLATVGPFLLAVGAVLVVVALFVPTLRRPSVPGILVGLSMAPLYIAWLNRDGPGLVCTSTATSTSCADAWSPWPFVAVGVLLAGGGLALLALGGRPAGPSPVPSAEAVTPEPRT